jgi:hypothetical protein
VVLVTVIGKLTAHPRPPWLLFGFVAGSVIAMVLLVIEIQAGTFPNLQR